MSGEYQPPVLVKFLHSFPHLDFTFKKLNSSHFNPDSQLYVESLLFWGSVPIVWLLLSLLLFLVYFCYRCCQRDVETKQRMPCLMWTLAILALVTCCVLGVGFAGVVEVKRGADDVTDALRDVNETMHRVRKQIALIQGARDEVLAAIIAVDNLSTNPVLINNKTDIGQRTSSALGMTRQIVEDLAFVIKMANDTPPTTSALTANFASASLWTTIGLSVFFGLCLIQCIILLVAIGRNSKCTLLVYCALGIMTMVLLWILSGFLLTTTVGLGDFCVDPDRYLEKTAAKQGPVAGAMAKYYIECTPGSTTNELTKAMWQSTSKIGQVNQTIQPILSGMKKVDVDVRDASQKLNNSLQVIKADITALFALVDCTSFHEDYIDALDGICHLIVLGSVLMWCSCVVTAFFFTILVIMASKAWRHMGKRKGYELVNYEANPYAREPPDAGLSPSSCQFYSSTRGSRGNPREHLALHHRTTPPPAYNCNEFYRTYSDMNQLGDDQRSDMGGRDTPA